MDRHQTIDRRVKLLAEIEIAMGILKPGPGEPRKDANEYAATLWEVFQKAQTEIIGAAIPPDDLRSAVGGNLKRAVGHEVERFEAIAAEVIAQTRATFDIGRRGPRAR
ncbi:hypothetical protein W2_gp034c [Caulobacter phage W2]|uniref:Uncharacterized protein n=1 Tax=Caulobacter phage TMCBR4 TaxID=3028191 RepID=A0AAF0CI23_9CAUD|nr:hypothetical protein TMCBR4_gp035c [Caulobacter phage TMCBR4]WDS38402.1 hypothetical protein W2_gp034c [Caulobacter phage W2]